jgi:hypothetical protein
VIVVRLLKSGVLCLSLVLVGVFGCVSPVLAASAWWHVRSSERPSYLHHGAAQNEVQELTISATGGTYELRRREAGHVAARVVAFDATHEELQGILEGMYGAGNVSVGKGQGDELGSDPYVIEFKGDLAGQAVQPVEALSSAFFGTVKLTGGREEASVREVSAGKPDGQVVVTVADLGEVNADGEAEPILVADKLPPGLKGVSIEGVQGPNGSTPSGPFRLECSQESLSCTSARQLAAYDQIEIVVGVVVQPGASSGEVNEVSVSGGQTPAASASRGLVFSAAPVPFGVEDYEISPEEEGGGLDTHAGSHPFQLTTALALNQTKVLDVADPSYTSVMPKDLALRLPPGLVGNATVMPQCSLAQFFTFGSFQGEAASCPLLSVIGVALVTLYEPGHIARPFTETVPVFNVEPTFGEPARFGFRATAGTTVLLDTKVRNGGDYGVTVRSTNISQIAGVISSQVTLWGVPGDPRHDNTRGYGCLAEAREAEGRGLGGHAPCDALGESQPPPFLQLPVSCETSLVNVMEADSWANRGVFESFSGDPLPTLDGCNQLPFSASIDVTPDTQAAGSPSGMTVRVHLPQESSLAPDGFSPSSVKDASVTLPQGVVLNPSGAGSLLACSEPEVGFQGIGGDGTPLFTPELGDPFCPDASKVGTVKVKTPLLPDPLEGFVYAAAQGANPYGSLIAIYILAQDPKTGVVAKVPGDVSLDPVTGQITATFHNLPQNPIEDIELHFFGGSRGPLATPALCGTYTTTASFTPWSAPPGATPVTASSAFQVTAGPNGTPCADPRPFAPALAGGSTNNQAGGFSPFTVTFSRQDQDQNIAGVSVTTPPGLLGIIKGVEQCPETQANQGTCGANSLIGHTTAAAGAGANPFYVEGGQVFLTGPYKGAPFGLSVVVPAAAGPYDLGTVVVRAAIRVDPHTARITVTSDPLPTILQGIPLDVRAVNVSIDRPRFTFNPTSCEPLAMDGVVTSTQGAQAQVSSRFQAANCANLLFKPRFTVSTQARTSKKNGASLDVKVGYPQGAQANIRSVAVTLPKALPSRLTTIQQACTEAAFNQNPASCPAGSNIGTATATTPVFANPITGPVYLVSHGGAAFPDVVIVFQGEGVTLDLVGSVNIKKQVTSSTFASVPDAPISSFELKLPEGPHSGLAAVLPAKAKGNLCGTSLAMPTTITGQNGAQIKQSTKIQVTGCTKAKKKPKARRKHAKRGGKK